MDKPKADSQDLTLLDEFEKNVETVIGILEDSVSIIDQWIKDLPKSARTDGRFVPKRTTNNVIAILESFYPFADLLPEIQRFLITHVPEFESKVGKKYSDINKKIEEIVGKCGQHPLNPPLNPAIPYGEMTELRRYIEKLIGDLSFCVKKAREKLATEKPAETEQEIKTDKEPLEAIAEEDQQLFLQIAIDVREHPNRYSKAGKWLDKYCREEEYWQRKEDELKKAIDKYENTANPKLKRDIEKLKKDIGKRQVSRRARFNEARHYWLDKYEEQNFMSEDDARCIILITWLLTDPDTENTNLNITEFAKWSWEPTDDILSDSRCAASLLWQQSSNAYRLWMEPVRKAWKLLEAEKPAKTERGATPAKRGRIKKIAGWIFKKTSHFIWTLIVTIIAGLIVAVLIDIFGEFGWLDRIKAFIEKIVWLE